MKFLYPLLFFIMVSNAQTTIGTIVTYDPLFAKIVAADAKIELLAQGLQWAEGPVWYKEGEFLLFSDPKQNTIFRWDETGGLQQFLKPSGYTGLGRYSDEPGSNGLLITPNDELVACEHGDRRISIMPLGGGGKLTIADRWEGKRFNSPNDICRHSNGTLYFSDPIYGLPGREKDIETKEMDNEGVYAIDISGKVTRVATMERPNGVALSPDEKILYVGQTSGNDAYITAFAVNADGSVGESKVFFDFSKHPEVANGRADGLKVDSHGNIFAGAANGIVVISAKGKLLGKIETGIPTANCAFGADNYLYITANHYLCRIKLEP